MRLSKDEVRELRADADKQLGWIGDDACKPRRVVMRVAYLMLRRVGVMKYTYRQCLAAVDDWVAAHPGWGRSR